MENVLEVYTRPYDASYPVICMDESSKQCVQEIRPPQGMRPGHAARYDAEYERNGVGHLLMYYAPFDDWRRTDVAPNHAAPTWAEGVRRSVEEDYPQAQRITLLMDNLSTHTGASLYKTFEPARARALLDKLEFVYTPKHGSWLNIAECEFSVLARQCLARRIADIDTLRNEVSAWMEQRNRTSKPVEWRFTTADARIKLRHLYPKVRDCQSTRARRHWSARAAPAGRGNGPTIGRSWLPLSHGVAASAIRQVSASRRSTIESSGNCHHQWLPSVLRKVMASNSATRSASVMNGLFSASTSHWRASVMLRRKSIIGEHTMATTSMSFNEARPVGGITWPPSSTFSRTRRRFNEARPGRRDHRTLTRDTARQAPGPTSCERCLAFALSGGGRRPARARRHWSARAAPARRGMTRPAPGPDPIRLTQANHQPGGTDAISPRGTSPGPAGRAGDGMSAEALSLHLIANATLRDRR